MDHSTTERKRTTRMGLFLVGIFIALLIVTRWMEPRYPAPAPQFYYPDPTPLPTYYTEVNIFSRNCIGFNVSC